MQRDTETASYDRDTTQQGSVETSRKDCEPM
jgi:hypothetical protein